MTSDRTGQVWSLISLDDKDFVFMVVGRSKLSAQGQHEHPCLSISDDFEPDTEGTKMSAFEPVEPNLSWETRPDMERIL